MPFKLAPRLDGIAYVGAQRTSVTVCVRDRAPVFTAPATVDPLVAQLLAAAARTEAGVIAYCVMPDHLHALVHGLSDAADAREFVRLFKQVSSFHWKRLHGRELWQRGYVDRVLRGDEDTCTVARYILDNPVRAGIVLSPSDYPFSGSGMFDLTDLLESVRRT